VRQVARGEGVRTPAWGRRRERERFNTTQDQGLLHRLGAQLGHGYKHLGHEPGGCLFASPGMECWRFADGSTGAPGGVKTRVSKRAEEGKGRSEGSKCACGMRWSMRNLLRLLAWIFVDGLRSTITVRGLPSATAADAQGPDRTGAAGSRSTPQESTRPERTMGRGNRTVAATPALAASRLRTGRRPADATTPGTTGVGGGE